LGNSKQLSVLKEAGSCFVSKLQYSQPGNLIGNDNRSLAKVFLCHGLAQIFTDH